MKHLFFKFFLVLGVIGISGEIEAQEVIKVSLIEKLKPAVISIKVKQTTASYATPYSGGGTGFVADKEKGIIITNRHIGTLDSPAQFEAIFNDGSTADLSFIYNDPTTDFAFLRVDPKLIPDGLPQLKFSRDAKVGEDVIMIGNNEGRSHSVQLGKVSDLFAIEDLHYPQQTFQISLNTRGGSSGSPVFNEKGEVIGINYAGNDTTAFAIPISYAWDALDKIQKNEEPPRFSLGAAFAHLNVDYAFDYYQYPNKNAKQRLAQIPSSRNRLLAVASIMPGTPAAKYLEVGDIIEKVGDTEIGPNLYLLEKLVNEAMGKPLKITFYRNGKLLEQEIGSYDMNKQKCSKIVIFGNTVFASVDSLMGYRTGMPLGSVCIANNPSGSLFEKLPIISIQPQVMIKKINGQPVHSIDDLIKILPKVAKLGKFNFVFQNFGVRCIEEGCIYNTHQNEVSQFVKYNTELYDAPVVIRFDSSKGGWVRQPLPL